MPTPESWRLVETEADFDELVYRPLLSLTQDGSVEVSIDTETTRIDARRGFNPFYGPRMAMVQLSWNDAEGGEHDVAVNVRMKPSLEAKPPRPKDKEKSKAFSKAWKVYAGVKETAGTWDPADLADVLDEPLEVQVPVNVDPRHVVRRLNELSGAGVVWILKNMKFDLLMLWADGFVIPPAEQLEDAEIWSHLTEDQPWVKGRRVSHNLQALAERHLNRAPDGEKALKAWFEALGVADGLKDYSAVPVPILGYYGTQDTRDTWDLFFFFLEKAKRMDEASAPGKSLFRLYEDEKRLVRNLVVNTIIPGLPIDQAQADRVLEKHSGLRNDKEEALYALTKRHVNWGSDDDVAAYFYDSPEEGGLGLTVPPNGFTNTGKRSVAQRVIQSLEHPVIDAYLEWRQEETFVSSFLEPIARFNLGGIIHPDFHITSVRTGRLSASHPNMQNRPKEEDIRSMFVARPGYVLVCPDYDQIEMRLAAHYSYVVATHFPTVWAKRIWQGRERGWNKTTAPDRIGLWEGFTKDPAYDPHQIMADTSGLPRKRSHAGQGTAKDCNFSIQYGVGIGKLASMYGWSYEYAKGIRSAWRKSYPEQVHLMNYIAKVLQERGWVANEFGRRYFIDPDKAYLGLNYVIQGTAGDLMKRGMNRVYAIQERMRESFEGPEPMYVDNQVHDELVLEVREDLVQDELLADVRREMVTWERDGEPMFTVPITAGFEVSESDWGHLRPYEWSAAA